MQLFSSFLRRYPLAGRSIASLCGKLLGKTEARRITRRKAFLIAAAAALPLSASLAAFSGAFGSSLAEENTAAAEPLAQISAENRTVAFAVGGAETLTSLLAKAGVSDAEAEHFIYASADASALASPRRGQFVRAEVLPDGRLQSLVIYAERSGAQGIQTTLSRTASGFAVNTASFSWERRESAASVAIGTSFRQDAAAAGVPARVIEAAQRVRYRGSPLLAGAVRGDVISLVYDSRYLDETDTGAERLLGVRLERKGGKTVSLHWFENGTASGGFYFADGSGTGIQFDRYPLKNFRLTSAFSGGRRHPVTGRIRAHKGVDLAAPSGTPVYAVADGVIRAADRSLSGYGNHIEISHGADISTLYAHLKGYAKGIRPGAPVTRGQLIGYCGSTGISTGSHVHFEYRIGSTAMNPASVALPSSGRLAAAYLSRGQDRVKSTERAFAQLSAIRTASAGIRTIPASRTDRLQQTQTAAASTASSDSSTS